MMNNNMENKNTQQHIDGHNVQSIKSREPDPKTKFQSRLNALLTDAVGKLESLAKEVLPKEELEKLSSKNEATKED
jgi:hypothetical protein